MPDLGRRPWLLPLVPLYGAGLRVASALRAQPKELRWPVISVGSLSAGGAGKTPVVKMLARVLQEHGVACDVLSRGYGRASGAIGRVDPDGDAREFGDEPVELAQAGLEVWVGAHRWTAGRAAEAANSGNRVHLLDDGFQHRRLRRALDVVLLTLEDVQDGLLPAGNLREPLRALRRADVLVVREEEAGELEAWTRGRECWVIRRRMVLPADAPHKPIAFCGIARPEGFFAGLVAAGCSPVRTIAFADHHMYRFRDITRMQIAARQDGADGCITTAKDYVKLTEVMRNRLAPIAIAELTVDPIDEAAIWERLAGIARSGPA